jgi:hypothetical protein
LELDFDYKAFEELSDAEKARFSDICGKLLAETFLTKTQWLPGGKTASNQDYYFLDRHSETVRGYLSLSGWQLKKDENKGFFHVTSKHGANKMSLNIRATGALLSLRLLYNENIGRAGLSNDVVCEVGEVIENLTTEFPVFKNKPNMEEFRGLMMVFDNHNIIKRISGSYKEPECRFAILPTILSAVPGDKLVSLAASLGKETDNGETFEEDLVD